MLNILKKKKDFSITSKLYLDDKTNNNKLKNDKIFP